MRNFFKTREDEAFQLLTQVAGDLRGIRIALENMALKQAALGAPSPQQPDDADFLVQSDGDLALLEKLGQARTGPGSDEVDLLAEAKADYAGGQAQTLDEAPRPLDSFLPRFPRR